MELWERPFIKLHDDPDDNVRLRPGMVICIEPILAPVVDGQLAGIFVFEQQVAITEAGNEVLSGDLEVKLWRAS
jgi:Xaa-Pro aminopeptidase